MVLGFGIFLLCQGPRAHAQPPTDRSATTPSALPPGTPAPQPPSPAGPRRHAGAYLDSDGRWREADEAYRTLHARKNANYWRAALWEVGILLAGTLWYVVDDRNVLDWDRPSLEQRFSGEAWTFDNNDFGMNFILHPWSGAAFYALPRGNGLGVGTSFAYGFATSLVWEYLIEFNEKVSINDILVTPGAGLPIGEFFHKLASYLSSAPAPSATQQAAQWLLGPTVAMHRAMDGAAAPAAAATDSLGFSADIWHRFDVGYGLRSTHNGVDGRFASHEVELAGELVTVPGYLRPGSFQRFFCCADFATLDAGVEYSKHGGGHHLFADTALLGLLEQRLHRHGTDTEGYVGKMALHLGYRYRNSRAAGLDERLGALHFPGPGAEFVLRHGQLSLRILTSAHGDFAGYGVPAYLQWRAAHPDGRSKSILIKKGYVFGWGWSARAGATVGFGPLELHGQLFYGAYGSQEGRDRTQEAVTHDVHSTSRVLQGSAELRLHPAESPLAIGARAGIRRWRSTMGSFASDDRITDAGLQLTTSF